MNATCLISLKNLKFSFSLFPRINTETPFQIYILTLKTCFVTGYSIFYNEGILNVMLQKVKHENITLYWCLMVATKMFLACSL